MPWSIVCNPVGHYPPNDDEEGEDQNRSYLEILLVGNGQRQSICCVGYARRHTKHPDVSFKAQLAHSFDDANEAVKLLNDRLASQDGLV